MNIVFGAGEMLVSYLFPAFGAALHGARHVKTAYKVIKFSSKVYTGDITGIKDLFSFSFKKMKKAPLDCLKLCERIKVGYGDHGAAIQKGSCYAGCYAANFIRKLF